MTATVDDLGRLCVGDVALTDIADEFRTPAYVLDESDFRHRLTRYRTTLRDIEIVYAAKSLLTTDVARWVAEEGAGLDVSSGGELATALAGGVDRRGSSCTATPIARRADDATAVGVGRVVVDSPMEIAYLACEVRRPQRVLIRVTPDIDIRGHAAVTTGVNDQKFGFTLAGGHAVTRCERILHQPLLDFVGLHCHIGSQITDPALYGEAIRRMIAAMADIRARHGVILHELNIGGGHGIPYVRATPNSIWPSSPTHRRRPGLGVRGGTVPAAADRGRARTRDECTRRCDAVLGGFGEVAARRPHVRRRGRRHVRQPARRALRREIHCGARQPPLAGPTNVVTVAGRHCESGDEIARDVELPADVHPGDLLAVACTGAYQHSMASNYNMVGRRRSSRSARAEPANSCAARRPRTCWPATADGQAASRLHD